MKKSALALPTHLSAESKRLWRQLAAEYALEDEAARQILTSAFESFDRARAARKAVAKDGMTNRDRFGQVRAHPLLAVERDARAAFLSALKQLNLDVEPLQDGPGRPPGGGRRR